MKKLCVVFSCIVAQFSSVGVFAQHCPSDSAKVFLYDDITSLMGEYKAVSTDILNVKTTVSKNFTDGEKNAVDKKSGGIQTGMIVGIAGSSIGAIGSAVSIGYNVSSMKSLDKTMATQAKSVSNIEAFKSETLKNATLGGATPDGLIVNSQKFTDGVVAGDYEKMDRLVSCLNDNFKIGKHLHNKRNTKIDVESWGAIGFMDDGEKQYHLYCMVGGGIYVDKITESISKKQFPDDCMLYDSDNPSFTQKPSWDKVIITKVGIDNITNSLTKIQTDWNSDPNNTNKKVFCNE